jgi:membrane protease YdiL (CAAX protease family)
MKLVQDAKDWWKWYSTWAMAFAASLPFAWAALPPDLKAAIPDNWMPYFTLAILLVGMAGRVVDQK